MNVLVVDYGLGNLASVRRAIEECGANVWISDHPDEPKLKKATHIVLPGVGSFTDGMRELDARGWSKALNYAVLEERKPLLGICLGMQLLADVGEEGGVTAGLKLIPGRVVRLKPVQGSERVSHVGWNEVRLYRAHALFDDIRDCSDFYFVHSYQFLTHQDVDAVAYTPYCGGFVSAVQRGHVCGVQFHPEKSSRNGLQLLRNFLSFGMSCSA